MTSYDLRISNWSSDVCSSDLPHVCILAWCLISYMNPHRLSLCFAYEFPVAMMISLSTLAAWVLSKEPKKLSINAVSALMLAFVVWMSFANLFAMVPDLAFEKWTQSVKILLMTFVTMEIGRAHV